MSEGEGTVPVLVPQVMLVAPSPVSLEMIAIAAGVFAIVTALARLYLPAEMMWLLVGALMSARRPLRELGLDMTFARMRPRAR